jgi:DNA primase
MFNFVQKVEGVDFSDALENLAEKAGVKIEKTQIDPNYKKKKIIFEINQIASEFYHHLLINHKVGKKGLKYLKEKRGLTDSTIKEFKLGYAPESWDLLYKYLLKKGYQNEDVLISGAAIKRRSGEGYLDKFRGRVVFPFVDVTGKIIGFSGRDIVGKEPKYLNTQDTLVFNKSAFIYGLDKAKVEVKKKGAVFVEGPMDVIKAFQNGIKNVIATSGTSLTSLQLKIISRYSKELIFSFDSDEAGLSATARALSLAEPFDFEVKVVLIPEKYADLDDFISQNSEKAKEALNNPVPAYDFYFANALKKYNKDTAYGKKKIIQYLSPVYSKISSPVVLDHYTKKVSQELDLNEEVIRDSLQRKDHETLKEELREEKESGMQPEVKKSPEEYFLSLLLKSDLDTMGRFMYKLTVGDFTKEPTQKIYQSLITYLDSKPKEFEIKYFEESLDDNLREQVREMYLWDFGKITDEADLLRSEIEATISRLEKESLRRKLKDLTEQIKLAELENDRSKVEKLSKKFNRLSKRLI